MSPEAEFFVREHEIVVNGLGATLKGFRYPYEDYIPKLTLGRIYKGVDSKKLDLCVRAAEDLLPVAVEVDDLKLFTHQEF